MNPIDAAILAGRLTREELEQAEVPPPGHSYWGDYIHDGYDRRAAVLLAARDMGATFETLASLSRRCR